MVSDDFVDAEDLKISKKMLVKPQYVFGTM